MAHISHVEFYEPETMVYTKDLLAPIVSQDAIHAFVRESGIRSVYIEQYKTAMQVADQLLERLSYTIDLTAVTHIFFASQAWIEQGLSVPYALVEKYKMANCSVFTLKQHCASCIQAIELADALVDSGMGGKIIILSLSLSIPLEKRRFGTTVFGDGAGLIVVEEQGFLRIDDIWSWSDGNVSLRTSRGQRRNAFEKVSALDKNAKYIKRLLTPGLLREATVIPLNTGNAGVTATSVMLEVPLDNIYKSNMEDGGHMLDVDIIRNICCLFKKRDQMKVGRKVALYAVGLELDSDDTTYALALLTINDKV